MLKRRFHLSCYAFWKSVNLLIHIFYNQILYLYHKINKLRIKYGICIQRLEHTRHCQPAELSHQASWEDKRRWSWAGFGCHAHTPPLGNYHSWLYTENMFISHKTTHRTHAKTKLIIQKLHTENMQKTMFISHKTTHRKHAKTKVLSHTALPILPSRGWVGKANSLQQASDCTSFDVMEATH